MILTFNDLLTEQEYGDVLEYIETIEFVDGKATAGKVAAAVKNNQQAPKTSEARQEVFKIVLNALRRHNGFRSATQPKQLHSLLINRYEKGMEYGMHIDNPLMGGEVRWRTDLSLTLFLSKPEDYDGGELRFEHGSGEMNIKLRAGGLVVYPSTTLHRVMPVTKGVRLAVVAWVQSMVREPANRELLYDLNRAQNIMLERNGKSREHDLVAKTWANLMRRWAEP